MSTNQEPTAVGCSNVTYRLTYRFTGPLYDASPYTRRRILTMLGHGGDDDERPVKTDEEALASLRAFIARPWAGDTKVEVMRLTKMTTHTTYEDVTHLAPPERT